MSKSAAATADALAERIGYRFRKPDLLSCALTHASLSGRPGKRSNERLEFLGDRVLGLVVAEELYRRHPRLAEGELARRLNMLVRKETCAEVALSVGLPAFVRSGRSIGTSEVESSVNVLGDACEAVVAAIYLDGGMDAARDFVLRQWSAAFERGERARKDPKTALQEWALARGLPTPRYAERSRQGPDHAPSFVVAVEVTDYAAAEGEGASKRQAEQAAAEAFLRRERVWRT